MPASIGVNLRVTGHCSQGGRKYMEDLFSVAYQQTEDERDLEYAFFGIYDGHGGSEAAAFAKEHLMDSIVKQRQFWSDNDEDVLKAIRNGYMLTHWNMWKELEKWPKTVTGLPSTAGTTASVAFIRRGKIYTGHVGDSAIVLGYQKDGLDEWLAKPLTQDHKPESTAEIERIQRCGGKVISKAGVPRVVWNRPRLGHKGPIKKNTPMDEIPFLAVARSLGDLWSYNVNNDEFIVSPDPDVGVLTIDPDTFRCLIFGTDGLWNMISPEGAVSLVQATERHNEAALVGSSPSQPRDWLNPSKSLVDHALERWANTRMRADNTSVVTLMLDPPGPPRATVLRSRGGGPPRPAPLQQPAQPAEHERAAVPQNGLTIMTRYSDVERAPEVPLLPAAPAIGTLIEAPISPPIPSQADDGDDSDTIQNYGNPAESHFMTRLQNRTRVFNTLAALPAELAAAVSPPPRALPAPRDSLPATVVPEPAAEAEPDAPPSLPPSAAPIDTAEPEPAPPDDDTRIQINEVSSSSPTEQPARGRGRRTRADPRAAPPAHDRVLRSHHDPEPIRPQTRRGTSRVRADAPSVDRVVLTRRAPPVPPLNNNTEPLPAPAERRLAHAPAPAPVPTRKTPTEPLEDDVKRSVRATRSTAAPSTPLAQKITRGLGACARELRGAAIAAANGARAGNSARAPGPARRAPAARRPGAHRSKENLGGARARGRGRADPVAHPPQSRPLTPPPRTSTRRADSARESEPEVHSTTGEPRACSAAEPVPEPPRPRALRSRNDAVPPASVATASPAACKRIRYETSGASGTGGKMARLAGGERCGRGLGKRASGPWAPAVALRSRLRRRLAK